MIHLTDTPDNGIKSLGYEPIRLHLDKRASARFRLQDVLHVTMQAADEAVAMARVETKEGPMIVLAALATLYPEQELWDAFEKYAKENLVVVFAQGINNVERFRQGPKPRPDPSDHRTN